ncbi:efflux RND transporter periplasmic adaptor subunit [Desulfovibrio sp. JC022]|uniref:efflux RND transporter periplasmic adaptor subunit n=1 Tax=Desulfovibrio sp. JC022 TaxID=2593642 RepID=UPI0013D2DAA3|nr:HlyD family efflux transporter periplasmic adaptor subunit [Desulfovibrio sp. JC022]NDV24270.1 HlyD family efflux transporter periplasmic adaptor subunit [Desulfovibrio sp. JC022]
MSKYALVLFQLFLMLLPSFCLAQDSSSSIGQEWEARGLIKAVNRVVLSSEISGRVAAVPFRAGESFKRGKVLLAFDCSMLKAELSKTRASLKGVKAKVDNDRRLMKLNSIGSVELALDEAELAQKQAELRIAQLAVGRCIVRDPFNGRVVRVDVRAHQSVKAQQELIEIVNPADLEAEVIIPSNWLKWVKRGHPSIS